MVFKTEKLGNMRTSRVEDRIEESSEEFHSIQGENVSSGISSSVHSLQNSWLYLRDEMRRMRTSILLTNWKQYQRKIPPSSQRLGK